MTSDQHAPLLCLAIELDLHTNVFFPFCKLWMLGTATMRRSANKGKFLRSICRWPCMVRRGRDVRVGVRMVEVCPVVCPWGMVMTAFDRV